MYSFACTNYAMKVGAKLNRLCMMNAPPQPPRQLEQLPRTARTRLRLYAKNIHNTHVHQFCPPSHPLPSVIPSRKEARVEIGDQICSLRGGQVRVACTAHALLHTTEVMPCQKNTCCRALTHFRRGIEERLGRVNRKHKENDVCIFKQQLPKMLSIEG